MTDVRASPSAPPDGRDALSLALPFYGVVALFAVGYALVTENLSLLLGEERPTWGGLLGAVGLALLLVVLARVAASAWGPARRTFRGLARLIGPVSLGQALLLALLSGVAEELLFRGALWPALGLVGTTLLFAVVHLLPKPNLWFYPLFALVAGLLLGVLRQATGSIAPPMLAHVLVNAANLPWLAAMARRMDEERAGPA